MANEGDGGSAWSEDHDGLAAEYVLGALDESERRAAEALLANDAGFRGAVADWERRLAPLIERVAPVEPGDALRRQVLDAVDALGVAGGRDQAGLAGTASGGDNVVRLEGRLRAWRRTAWLSGAMAAGLAALLIGREATRPPGGSFVAVLDTGGHTPAFVAAVDVDRGTIAVRRIGAEPVAGKSYELWAVGAGRAAPQSLGLVGASLAVSSDRLAQAWRYDLDETTFAVSLEPTGGSPTGAPTGPVLFTGKLISTAAKK